MTADTEVTPVTPDTIEAIFKRRSYLESQLHFMLESLVDIQMRADHIDLSEVATEDLGGSIVEVSPDTNRVTDPTGDAATLEGRLDEEGQKLLRKARCLKYLVDAQDRAYDSLVHRQQRYVRMRYWGIEEDGRTRTLSPAEIADRMSLGRSTVFRIRENMLSMVAVFWEPMASKIMDCWEMVGK